jgi:3D (Asp-Asp-Asp) domain-containing protein
VTGVREPGTSRRSTGDLSSLNAELSIPAIVEDVLRSPGQALDPATRAFMEPRVGHDFRHIGIASARAPSDLMVGRANDPLERTADQMAERILTAPSASGSSHSPFGKVALSGVRIHTDSRAASSAHALDAKAYTVGRHIVFGANEFAPETMTGKRLFAHELAHVLQQSQFSGDSNTLLQRQKKPGKADTKKSDQKESPKDELRKDSQADARALYERLKALDVEAEEPVEARKHWVVRYRKLNKQQAKAKAAEKQKDLGNERTAGVDYDEESDSFYVKILLNCPAGVPAKAGYHIWPECFSTKNKADAIKQKLLAGYGSAEFFSRSDAIGFGLYYKAIATADLANQQASATKQLDTEKSQAPLKKCPDGYKDIGQFLVTTYHLPQEAEFASKPIRQNPSGLTGDFRDDFLGSVVVEGAGVALSGDIIQYDHCAKKRGDKCSDPVYRISPCAETKSGTCATAGRTVAVDPDVIPLKSELFIESVGSRIAEDTGGDINGQHIDVYRGLISAAQAKKLTLPGKPRVCMKSKGDSKPASKAKDE